MLLEVEFPRDAEVKESSFNSNYPKILVDKDGKASVLESSVPTLSNGESVAEPLDSKFGINYSLLTFKDTKSSYVIHYIKSGPVIPTLPITITSINGALIGTLQVSTGVSTLLIN